MTSKGVLTALQPMLNLFADVLRSSRKFTQDSALRGKQLKRLGEPIEVSSWSSHRWAKLLARRGKRSATSAWDTKAKLQRVDGLAGAGCKDNEDEARRPGPQHYVVQVDIGMNNVVRVKHTQSSTDVAEEFRQVLLSQKFKR